MVEIIELKESLVSGKAIYNITILIEGIKYQGLIIREDKLKKIEI